jgi:hypothetical protein
MTRSFTNCLLSVGALIAILTPLDSAQNRQRKRPAKPSAQTQAPKGSGAKYSAFLHSSAKHKALTCDTCHKVPTTWTAKREFPDVADFPDHDACVRCHRQQFFTRQAFRVTGPTICTVCHLRAAPREDARFAFGKPNNSQQATKPKDERQFNIEFPHDKHQNVIASLRPVGAAVRFVHASLAGADDQKKIDYNNCSICHVTNKNAFSAPPTGWVDSFVPPAGTFKTMPHSHDACFDCHWKSQKPASDDCGGCHKLSDVAVATTDWPVRKSAKFNHAGGNENENHLAECTTCHINITRARTLRGLTPDVPISACATCHNNNKKFTFPKIISIEDELAQFKKTGQCTYCHTSDLGKKKPPASHEIVTQ